MDLKDGVQHILSTTEVPHEEAQYLQRKSTLETTIFMESSGTIQHSIHPDMKEYPASDKKAPFIDHSASASGTWGKDSLLAQLQNGQFPVLEWQMREQIVPLTCTPMQAPILLLTCILEN